MATRKGVLQISHEGLAVVASFETERLEAQEIEETPEIVRWDPETDQPVIRQRYVKPAHEELEEGSALPKGTVGYRYVNEDGEEVPQERLVYVQRTDGDVKRIEKRPSTVLKGDTVPIEKWVSSQQASSFLFDKVYEVWGQEQEDNAELQRLAEWIDEHGETAMLVWMLQPAFYKTWGVIVPEFDEEAGTFAILVKTFRKRLDPGHAMPVLETQDMNELIQQAEAHFAEQEAPA